MRNKSPDPTARLIPEADAKLAATLRRVACDVERGEVRQVVMTVIRLDGAIERLGNVRSNKLH